MVVKICVLLSSYEGTESPFAVFDEYQNPARYLTDGSYEFTSVLVKKATAREQIDEAVNPSNGFDYFWNFMWGLASDNVAGVEAVEYLESLIVPLIGASSRFISLGKLETKRAAALANVKVPKWALSLEEMEEKGLGYPVFVKPSYGCGSLYTTENSVCRNKNELVKQIEWLKNQTIQGQIMIEEFIEGREITVIVVETIDGLKALQPLEWLMEKQDFFHFQKKFAEPIKFNILTEETPLVAKIKSMGCKIYDYLGVRGSGYASVDMRVMEKDEVYILEVNPTPAFFCPMGSNFGDDDVISETYPGGHKGLVETIIKAKEGILYLSRYYDGAAIEYEAKLHKMGPEMFKILSEISSLYDFSETVLDLGCGTGIFGRNIKEFCQGTCDIEGVDISRGMTKQASEFYSKIHIGLMENVVIELMEKEARYDHIVSSGCFPFLDKKTFERLLQMVFLLARKSVTFVVEEITEAYNSKLKKKGKAVCYNHVDGLEKIPDSWKIAKRQRRFLWNSPITGVDVYGDLIRYENAKN